MRLFDPVQVAFGEATLVAVIGLVINLISALLLGHDHSHDHGHHGHAHDHKQGHADNNLRAAYMHVLTDALTDRKSTRLNPVTNAQIVCRLLLEKTKKKQELPKI